MATSKVLAATTLLGLAACVYLYLDNRSLRAELAERPAPASGVSAKPDDATLAGTAGGDPWLAGRTRSGKLEASASTAQPALPEQKEENRLERRARRTEEF